MSSSSQAPESWISAFCSLVGHEYFAEVSEDFIEDDFNLTGLQSQVPMYKEALEMILDVEPEDATDEEEEEEEEEEEDEDEMHDGQDGVRTGYRRSAEAAAAAAERSHLRMASDLSMIESSAEMLYGLIHQRFITSRPGIQQMAEKYELGHFGHCPRVFCHGAKVLPVGCSDIPGTETVKLFCPSCLDVYSPPNSRFQTVDGAFFGTTFGCLFFMTFPELDVGGTKASPEPNLSATLPNNTKDPRSSLSSSLTSQQQNPPPVPSSSKTPIPPPPTPQPSSINGVAPKNLAPGLGLGNIYEPRIYGFRVAEVAKTGPRMKWLRQRPTDVNELDECTIFDETQALMRTTDAGEGAGFPDSEMIDENAEVQGNVGEDQDMDASEQQVDAATGETIAQMRDVARRKSNRRRPANGLVNGESHGGTAVRVGDGG
ncbi:Hypothetical protein R9X50_00231000 [Acrodontium crateriforme]|uniref:Casein kinase II subunit beta n=1 Tax=Acrodontium crateriforme TaxID=150365 RepID=A0AAQ3R3D9_9PEZI|nr:Hypothetical protein R9X50_00231000 [Acrodontium crateriforme]